MSRCIRNSAAGGASSANRTSVLIGVTWVTTTTVCSGCCGNQRLPRPPHPAGHRGERLAAGRRDVRRSSPGGELLRVAARAPRRRSALRTRRSRSRRDRPPIGTASPSRSAIASAVCIARGSGELTTAATSSAGRARSASGRGLRRGRRRRAGGRCGRRSAARAECSVAPCRTSTSRVRRPGRRHPVGGRPPTTARGLRRRRRGLPAARSIASLASRSACLLRSRGIHSKETSSKRRPQLGRLPGERAHRRVLHLPASGHLLDDELGVHPDGDPPRAEIPGGGRARRSGRGTRRRCWWRCRSTRCARPARRRSRRRHDGAVARRARVAA